jgi:hypothetical protein
MIPSDTLVTTFEEEDISTSYTYLPATKFEVALEVSDRLTHPVLFPVAVKATELEEV